MELWTKSSALSAGISGSIGNGILGEYFPEREYNLLNPKRTRKRPKFQPCLGPTGRNRVPQDVPGPLKTNEDPAGRIRTPCEEPGLSRTKRGPPSRIYVFVSECAALPQKIVGKSEFFTPLGPKPSSPRVLLGCFRVKH